MNDSVQVYVYIYMKYPASYRGKTCTSKLGI